MNAWEPRGLSDKTSRSVTEAAYDRLRRDLMSGRLPPGGRLKINDLCSAMGLNLSAVREALSKLSSEGFVIALPHRGFRAAPVSPADLTDLTRARIEIETACLKRSILLGDVDWETGVAAAAYAMDRTPSAPPIADPVGYERWCLVHESFHRALCAACDSTWLLRMRDTLFAQSERYRQLSIRSGTKRRAATDEHRVLATAVLQRNTAQAVEIITSHFQITAATLLDSWATPAGAAEETTTSARAGRLTNVG